MAVQHPELNAFVTVARLGSFTRAASELNVSQPALSRRIQILEQSLEVTLFDRVPDGVRLNEAGRTFLPYAEHALKSLREGSEAVRAGNKEVRGRVGLAIASTAGYRHVTLAVEAFRREHDAVELTLHTGTSAEVSDLVVRGEADIGLRFRTDPLTGLDNHIIGEDVVEIVCSPQHKFAQQKAVTPAELAEQIWIGYPYQRTAPDAGLRSVHMRYGVQSARFMAVHSTELQIELIASNFGVGLLPHGTVVDALRDGRLVSIKAPGSRNVVPIVLVSRKGASKSAAAEQLAGVIEDTIAKKRWKAEV